MWRCAPPGWRNNAARLGKLSPPLPRGTSPHRVVFSFNSNAFAGDCGGHAIPYHIHEWMVSFRSMGLFVSVLVCLLPNSTPAQSCEYDATQTASHSPLVGFMLDGRGTVLLPGPSHALKLICWFVQASTVCTREVAHAPRIWMPAAATSEMFRRSPSTGRPILPPLTCIMYEYFSSFDAWLTFFRSTTCNPRRRPASSAALYSISPASLELLSCSAAMAPRATSPLPR